MPSIEGEVLCFGDFELVTSVPELRERGELVDLTLAPTRTLLYLVRRADQLVPREDLYDHLWPEGGVDVDRALNTYIRQIRRALGERGGENRFIRTHPGRGYRFVAEVTSSVGSAREEVTTEGRDGIPARGRVAGWAAAALTLAAAAAFLFRPGSPPPLDETTRLAFLTGVEHLERPLPWHRAEGAEAFRRVIEVRPDYAPAHGGLAESLLWARRWDEAGSAARAALALDPDEPRALRVLGTVVLLREWNWAEAERLLRRGVAVAPDDPESHLALAFHLVVAGRPGEARRSLDRSVALDPTSPVITGDLGLLYGWIGDWETSRDLCARTLEIEPAASWAEGCLRTARWELGLTGGSG